jgi:aspartate/methionine/tyrosine aminotransferase
VFSARLTWDRSENALARCERARRAAGQPVVDLTESNPTRVDLPYPTEALSDALGAGAAQGYDPAPFGLASAREAVARGYQAVAAPIDAGQIVVTASSSESYALLFKLLCDPGDAVLVPEPSYPLFDYLARLEGVRSIGYRLAYDGEWHIDFDSMAAAQARAGGRARALVVVNPNNPTGSFVGASDLARLAEVAATGDLAVISDEVFADYRFAGARAPAAPCLAGAPAMATRALTFSLGGLSKASGLPHLKLGWIAVAGPPPLTRDALARLELINDTYLSAAGPVQRALPQLLDLGAGIRTAIQHRVARNRSHLVAALGAGCPCTCLNAEGGWTAIVRVPDVAGDGASDERWALRLLAEDGVLVHPGYLFDMPAGAYLVVSLLPEPDTFDRGIDAIVTRCRDSVP